MIGGLVLFWAFGKTIVDGINPTDTPTWLGLSHSVFIGFAFFLLGFVLMMAMWASDKTFFQRPLEVAPDGLLAGSPTVEVGAD